METSRERERQAARMQTMFRAVNEKVLEGLRDDGAAVDVVCECADAKCVESLQVKMDEYDAVRRHPSRFVVLGDHVYPDVERVVGRTDGYVVVEKNPGAAEITESTAPQR